MAPLGPRQVFNPLVALPGIRRFRRIGAELPFADGWAPGCGDHTLAASRHREHCVASVAAKIASRRARCDLGPSTLLWSHP
jgi:hypothetical protein